MLANLFFESFRYASLIADKSPTQKRFLALVTVFASLFAVLSPLALKGLIDSIALASDLTYMMLAAYLISFLALRLMNDLRFRAYGALEQRSLNAMSGLVMSRLMKKQSSFFASNDQGKVYSIVDRGLNYVREVVFAIYFMLLPIGLDFLGTALVLIWLWGWFGAGLAAAFAVALMLVIAASNSRLDPIQRMAFDNYTDFSAKAQEGIRCFDTIKAYQAEERILRDLSERMSRTNDAWLKYFHERFKWSAITATLVFLFMTALLTSLLLMTDSPAAAGSIAMVNMYLFNLLRPIENLANACRVLQKANHALRRLFDLIGGEQESPSGNQMLGPRVQGGPHEQLVGMASVSFRHSREGSPRLMFDFSVPIGEHVAVVGPSGSGKSTFLKLMAGLYSPEAGRILHSLQVENTKIGYVPQSPAMLNESIASNVALGAGEREIDVSRVEYALMKAELLSFVQGLSGGIHSKSGHDGGEMSGGQKQRVTIARAIYNEPQILILDEFTANLDLNTQRRIFENMLDLPQKPTIIAAIHDLSLLKFFNTIIFIDKGSIRAAGPFNKIVEECHDFRAFFSSGGHDASECEALGGRTF